MFAIASISGRFLRFGQWHKINSSLTHHWHRAVPRAIGGAAPAWLPGSFLALSVPKHFQLPKSVGPAIANRGPGFSAITAAMAQYLLAGFHENGFSWRAPVFFTAPFPKCGRRSSFKFSYRNVCRKAEITQGEKVKTRIDWIWLGAGVWPTFVFSGSAVLVFGPLIERNLSRVFWGFFRTAV